MVLHSCIMTAFDYCYNKCMKKFFGYTKYYSITEMLLYSIGFTLV